MKVYLAKITILITFVFVLSLNSVEAGVISADIREELSFFDDGQNGRVLEVLSQPIIGDPDLTADDEIANPPLYSGLAEVDLSPSGVITLTGDLEGGNSGDYQLMIVRIENIAFNSGDAITGITTLSDDIIDPQADNTTGPWTVTAEYTSNSATITYTTNHPTGTFNLGNGMKSSFQLMGITSADFDQDQDIDGKDFLTWQSNFGGQGSAGDANHDNKVDISDLAIWESSFGTAQPMAVISTVPEPNSFVLLACGLLFMSSKRRFSN